VLRCTGFQFKPLAQFTWEAIKAIIGVLETWSLLQMWLLLTGAVASEPEGLRWGNRFEKRPTSSAFPSKCRQRATLYLLISTTFGVPGDVIRSRSLVMRRRLVCAALFFCFCTAPPHVVASRIQATMLMLRTHSTPTYTSFLL
jgi:hypothetical protein